MLVSSAGGVQWLEPVDVLFNIDASMGLKVMLDKLCRGQGLGGERGHNKGKHTGKAGKTKL